MSQELVNKQTGEIADTAYTREKVDLIKRTIAKGASDDELQLFIHICKRSGLDPFARQIYAIKRKSMDDKGNWIEVMQPQTSIDGYRLIAERTGKYVPGRSPEFTYDQNGKLLAARAFIKKYVENGWHDIDAEAYYDEYVQKKADGMPTAMWQKMPRVMLAKCAESLAIRRAFPDQTSGLYTVEEMGQAVEEPAPVQMPKSKQETAAAPAFSDEDRTSCRKKFHAKADAAGLSEEDKKKFLKAMTGQDSTKDLSQVQFDNLFAELDKALEPPNEPPNA